MSESKHRREQMVKALLLVEAFLYEDQLTPAEKHQAGLKIAAQLRSEILDPEGVPPLRMIAPGDAADRVPDHVADPEPEPADVADNPNIPGFDLKSFDDCIDRFLGQMAAAGASEGRQKELGCAFAGGAAYLSGMFLRMRARAHAMSPDKPDLDAILYLFRSQTPVLDQAIGTYVYWLNEGKRPFKLKAAAH